MAGDSDLAQEVKELRKRIQLLEDKEAIRELLSKYCFIADLDRVDAFAELWTEDSAFDVGPGEFDVWKGKEGVRQFLQSPRVKAIARQCQHLILNLSINVEGNAATATGQGMLSVRSPGGFSTFSCSLRTFRLRRIEQRWLIQEAVARQIGDPACESIAPAEF